MNLLGLIWMGFSIEDTINLSSALNDQEPWITALVLIHVVVVTTEALMLFFALAFVFLPCGTIAIYKAYCRSQVQAAEDDDVEKAGGDLEMDAIGDKGAQVVNIDQTPDATVVL